MHDHSRAIKPVKTLPLEKRVKCIHIHRGGGAGIAIIISSIPYTTKLRKYHCHRISCTFSTLLLVITKTTTDLEIHGGHCNPKIHNIHYFYWKSLLLSEPLHLICLSSLSAWKPSFGMALSKTTASKRPPFSLSPLIFENHHGIRE